MIEVPEHLGGHANDCWIDQGSLKYMYDVLDVRSMVDIGCGIGIQVETARELGMKAWGIDGDPTTKPDFLIDFTKETLNIDKEIDLAWSVEFLEHVPIQFTDNYMKVFEKCKYVICTARQIAGNYHYNLKHRGYWIDLFEQYGFEYSPIMFFYILQYSTMKPNRFGHTWLHETGMCFVKKGQDPYPPQHEQIYNGD